VVRETLDAYAFQLEQQGFTLESRVEPGVPPVSADPDAVTQALLNLMDNAIKYSPANKVVKVEFYRQDGNAVISVEDRGLGISPREQAKIFEKFYRVEKSLVHDVKGSGLGLSLVKHIVDAHGGSVTVESRPGQGSRFSLHFPLAPPPAGGVNEGIP
jgi:signal transduction histidine kinase